MGKKLRMTVFKGSSQNNVFASKCSASSTWAPTFGCKKGQKSLSIVFMADDRSKRQNSIFIEKRKRNKKWKRVGKKLRKSNPSEKITEERCLPKKACYRVRITDKNGDGIDIGWYKVTFDGVQLKHKPFNSGKQQVVKFGK